MSSKKSSKKMKLKSKNRLYTGLLLFVAVALVGLVTKSSLDRQAEKDLSVIGSGSNVVVQIHDPN